MNTEPSSPYIYQPYGMQDKLNWNSGRIYGIAGHAATIKGLTQKEADSVLAALQTGRVKSEFPKQLCAYKFKNERKIQVTIVDHEYDSFSLNFMHLDDPSKDTRIMMRPDECLLVIQLLSEALFKSVKDYLVEIPDGAEYYGKE